MNLTDADRGIKDSPPAAARADFQPLTVARASPIMGGIMRGVKRIGAGAMPSGFLPILAVTASFAALSGPGALPSEAEPDPLLGRTRPAAILDITPEWQRGYEEYRPAPADLAIIRSAPAGSLLMVYFGSWCSDSRIGMPHVLKILDEAHAPHLKARYVGVDRAKREPAGRLEGVGLELVPTFVLSVDGREIGRIVETPKTTLEHDLALLIGEARMQLERHEASPGGKAASAASL